MEELKVNKEALKETWKLLPELNQKQIERALIGGTILNIYPLFGLNPDGSRYLTGFSIAIRKKNGKIITLDIDSHIANGENDGETGYQISKGYVCSEAEAFSELNPTLKYSEQFTT